MAVRLQFGSLVLPRSALARCRGLPPYLQALQPQGGFLFDTAWFDAHLLVETSMDARWAEELEASWLERGLLGPEPGPDGRPRFRDYCLATRTQGPLGSCDWLAFDPAAGAVWLRGTEPGEVIGGREDLEARERALATWEAQAEAAYAAMYEARWPKDDRDDACLALGQAQAIADFLNRPGEVARLAAREAHIRAVYDHQFRR